MAFKIALSAGHGYNTLGKRCLKKLDPKQTREWTLNSRICNKIAEKLKSYEGYELLRVDDTTGKSDVSISNRAKKSNNFKADIYIAIHHDAGLNGKSGGGISAFCHPKGSKASFEWRNDCYKALIEHTGLKGNRAEPLKTANFGECRLPNCAAILIEHGFMDSKDDTPIILTDNFANKVAEAYVEVIVKKGKLTKIKTQKTESKPNKRKSNEEIAKEVINGKWGNGAVRKKKLTDAGYNYKEIQAIVNKLCK